MSNTKVNKIAAPLSWKRTAWTELERPLLGTLGDCLEATAKEWPSGFTRITADIAAPPWDGSGPNVDTMYLEVHPVTAAIPPRDVTIMILGGTDPKVVLAMLKEAADWVRRNGKELQHILPKPAERNRHAGGFDDPEDLPF